MLKVWHYAKWYTEEQQGAIEILWKLEVRDVAESRLEERYSKFSCFAVRVEAFNNLKGYFGKEHFSFVSLMHMVYARLKYDKPCSMLLTFLSFKYTSGAE